MRRFRVVLPWLLLIGTLVLNQFILRDNRRLIAQLNETTATLVEMTGFVGEMTTALGRCLTDFDDAVTALESCAAAPAQRRGN
jgi:hypothetical protein